MSNKEKADDKQRLNVDESVKNDSISEVFVDFEEMPQFPGGVSALLEFLRTNVRYPKDAFEANVQGRVLVTFVIEKDGSICEAKVVKPVYPSLDEEALRVVNGMPNWEPGKVAGEPVRVKYTIPIAFKLQGDETKKKEAADSNE